MASVRELVPDVVEIPLFVGGVFEELDPMVRNAHAEAVVEAESAVRRGLATAGHSGEVLCDGEGVGIDFANEGVGELEVVDGVVVYSVTEVFVVVVEGGVAMVVVEHGGDAIEAKAIEAKVF